MINTARQLALDLAGYDIRVNSASLGNAGSPVAPDEQREYFDTIGIPLDKVGTPEAIGKAAHFLASNQADYVTGADLPSTAGRTDRHPCGGVRGSQLPEDLRPTLRCGLAYRRPPEIRSRLRRRRVSLDG